MKKIFAKVRFAEKGCITKIHEAGSELTGFDQDRIDALIKRGIAEYEEKQVADIDLSGNVQDVISDVKAFEDIEKLNFYLEIEQDNTKPRKSVVKAIEERISELTQE